jgi:cobaltochelatase CobT
MRGQKILLAAAALDIAGDFLVHLGASVEILGFTTVGWKGGKSRLRWLEMKKPPNPGRLCDLLHIVYRVPVDSGAVPKQFDLSQMLRPGLLRENVDGEAVEWAASRLRARSRPYKLLLVISDGAPVDDSTLLANHPNILDRHLRQIVCDLEAGTEIRTAAIGIGFDVSRFYSTAITVSTPDDLGTGMIDLLEGLITELGNGGP